MANELGERAALLASARRWIHTRFHHHAAIPRGPDGPGGIDCAHLIAEAHIGAGLADRFAIEGYPNDWHMHRDEERFLARLEQYLKRVDNSEASIAERGRDFFARPGNVLIWRFGRTFSHAAIAAEWPKIIHASFPARSCLEESCYGGDLERRPMRIYSLWGR